MTFINLTALEWVFCLFSHSSFSSILQRFVFGRSFLLQRLDTKMDSPEDANSDLDPSELGTKE